MPMTLAVTAEQATEAGYAERLYAEFAASTHGQVSIELKTVGTGKLHELAGQKVVDLVGVPLYTVSTVNTELGMESAQFDDVNLKLLSLEYLDADLDQFDDGGLPLSEGTFRQFAVTVTIGQEARTHTAAELCWSAQEQCIVFDPNIDSLNSMQVQAAEQTGVDPATSGGPYRILQFNSCGNRCDRGSTGAAVDALVNTIIDFKPHVVTLNEMCLNQYSALRTRIANRGWAMNGAWATTNTRSDLNCTDRTYGIALLSRSELRAPSTTCLANCSTPTSQAEQRVLLCALVTLHVRTTACVTHIGTSGQDAQIRTLTETVNRYEANAPVIIGGDFNVEPSHDALDRLYSTGGGGAAGRFVEADACTRRTDQSSTCNEGTLKVRFGTDPKIDYVFASARDFFGLSADATSATHSDHDPLRATMSQCSTRNC